MPKAVIVRVNYPRKGRQIVLRTSEDWNKDIQPLRVSDDVCEFAIQSSRPLFDFKPLLYQEGQMFWSHGENYTVSPALRTLREIYPSFLGHPYRGQISHIIQIQTALGPYRMRIYTPPGYQDNPLKRYPVLYMHDGTNLFFDEEAFLHREWNVDETMDQLNAISVIDKTIVVGIYAQNRMRDYTAPGYQFYGKMIVEHLKPMIDKNWRTLPGPSHTAVMGSSLGGLVSFYLAWQYPSVFSKVACMSATFEYQDHLLNRVINEPKRPLKIYLDSGYPRDNYMPTRHMRDVLMLRGYGQQNDLLYFSFPGNKHSETFWSQRLLLPFQYLFGKQP